MPPLSIILFFVIGLVLVPIVVALFLEERRSRVEAGPDPDEGPAWDRRSPTIRRLVGEPPGRGQPDPDLPDEGPMRQWRDISLAVLAAAVGLFLMTALAFGINTPPAPTESPAPSVVVSDTPVATDSPTPTESPTPSASPSPSPTRTPRPTSHVTFPPIITPPPKPSPTPTPSHTPSPTPSSGPTPTPAPTPTPTLPTPTP